MEGMDDKERLKTYVHARMNRFFNEVLSVIQLISKSEYQYNASRAKVLRYGNNSLREILKEVDEYSVKAGPNAKTFHDVYDPE